MFKLKLYSLAFCVIFLGFLGCNPKEKSDNSQQDSIKVPLNLIATTGQINSALERITAGTEAKIKLFCGPGVDPHSFQASTNDVQAMLDADLIIYNGFHLEAQLSEYLSGEFKDKSWAMASAFPEQQRLDWVEDGKIDPAAPFDPHIWNHLPGWADCVTGLAETLAQADQENAEIYRENSATYVAELLQAHQWAAEKLAALPENRRTIVSAHDAFGYFAKNYGMTTSAPLGVGNDAEADIKTMREIAVQICDEKIPAIFLESITSRKVTQALSEACEARGWKVKIVEQPLYSDDIGEEPPCDTFLGAFRSNVTVIHDALIREDNQQ